MELPRANQRMNVRLADGWRIFRLANGWGAMVFDPYAEEPFVGLRVDSQGADDGRTLPDAEISSYLYSQQGEAPQAVLRACEGYSGQGAGSEEARD